MSEHLSLQNLTLAYSGQVAVPDLSLDVAQGELIALLGPSGCGKTTTMRAIAGLMEVSSGRILLAGEDITRKSAHKREVGLVFQSYALFPHLSVFENVAFGLRLRHVPQVELTRRVSEAISLVGLGGFERRLPKELSGGQQQRVALARSVVVRPQLLLLDEPLSNLDARLRLEMRGELQRLQRELGVTMLYVTHDQVEALALAHRVVVMRQGSIAQQGSPQQIYQSPVSAFVARFVGFENLVSAQDLLANGAADLPAGVRHVAWRPRSVVLGAGPHRGQVSAQSYLGDAVEYLIHSPFGPIKAQTDALSPPHPIGTELRFDLPVAQGVQLKED
ncbi:MAG: spermidine/putrescine transporter, ATP-binding protein [Pseudomonadota bacterium]|jgi:putative spermidine/putrescine transport system ATP-binding protein